MPKEKRALEAKQASAERKTGVKRVKLDKATATSAEKSAKPAVNGKARELVSSKETHQKQKALAKERKANKPNADVISRSKKIWERLRRKSHVPKDERDELVKELFSIITGRVKDFVFKHDSGRSVQCALKYATAAQTKIIAKELQGEFKTLAEGRYSKFLVAKMIVEGDQEVKDMIIAEFYGSVRRMITHPEAAWILDDTYRQVATSNQKALLLREWYGTEFAIENKNKATSLMAAGKVGTLSGDLLTVLASNPEKRKPIMDYLHSLIDLLVQKEKTGFTILHDAMLQYSLAVGVPSNSEAATEFIELLKGDEKGDLLKNLAFTKGGARVVARALAFGNAKDRKHILRTYKDHIQTLAFDPNASIVLLAAFETIDDTKMTAKAIFPELLDTKQTDVEQRYETLLQLGNHLHARTVLLYPLTSDRAKWLFPPALKNCADIIREVRQLRSNTSKKDPDVRQRELAAYLAESSNGILDFITARVAQLLSTSFGCQFVGEVLLAPFEGEKKPALKAIAQLATGDPAGENHTFNVPDAGTKAAAGRMLKTLVSGAKFDPATQTLVKVEPPLNFPELLWPEIEGWVVAWATGPNSFVVVNMLEDTSFEGRGEVKAALNKKSKEIKKAGDGGNKGAAMVADMLK